LAEMPKNENKNCPVMVKAISTKKEMTVARMTMCALCCSSMPVVIVRNTGIVPSGLVSVKNDAKAINANGRIVSIVISDERDICYADFQEC